MGKGTIVTFFPNISPGIMLKFEFDCKVQQRDGLGFDVQYEICSSDENGTIFPRFCEYAEIYMEN